MTPITIIPFPNRRTGATRSESVNLELVEERCLVYLAEASNPLVPCNTLFDYCRRHEALRELAKEEFLHFLRHHHMIRVIEAVPLPVEGVSLSEQEREAATEPRVILKSRVPSPAEMNQLMTEQINRMTASLNQAIQHARTQGDTHALDQLNLALERVRLLGERIKQLE